MENSTNPPTKRPTEAPRPKGLPGTLIALLLGALLLFFALSVRREQHDPRLDSGYRPMMGTYAQIVLRTYPRSSGQAIIEAAMERLKRVDDLMSYHRSDSELARINAEAHASPVTVDEQTFDVLKRAVEISRLSDGAFDITVGPLVDLWNRAADRNAPPTQAELSEARSKVGWQRLTLDYEQRSIAFSVAGMRIDLGGIAKGYAIDRAVDLLQQRGVTDAMVDIGGDIRCFNLDPGGRAWRIGVEDPDRAEQGGDDGPAHVAVLGLQDKAVATSGHYRRFVLVDGKRVSHILDARSGQGSDRLKSVSILADDAMTADALATAVSALGRETGLALIESLEGVEAFIIVDDPHTPLTSSGIPAYLQAPR